jgi:3-hydroxyisobutyrate dehydrogenase
VGLEQPRARVAVLGTGLMGSGVARRLSSQGFEVILWNRTLEKAESLASAIGAKVGGSPHEAVEGAEVALAFLADDEALFQVASMLRRADGLVFINASTTTPKANSHVSTHLEGLGICFLEGPVVGGPDAAARGELVSIIAGREQCLRRAVHVVRAYSRRLIYLGGEVGKASALKLAFNSVLIASQAILAEAMRLVDLYGVDHESFKSLLGETVFREFSDKYYDRLLSERRQVSFRLAMAAKDLEYARRASFDAGFSPPTISAAGAVYSLASTTMGGEDYSRVYMFLKRLGGESGGKR